MTFSTRLLVAEDAAAYRSLRLRALAEHPEAFTSSVEEEAERPLGWTIQRVGPNAGQPHDFVVGAFATARAGGDEQLVGYVGLAGRYRPKERHNATVVGMYVVSDMAGQGIGAALMRDLLARARLLPVLEQIDLTVTEGNPAALRTYERCGFTVFGVLPHAIKVAGRDHAKIHMVLRLR